MEYENQEVGLGKIFKRVAVSNCVKRAFVNACGAAMGTERGRGFGGRGGYGG